MLKKLMKSMASKGKTGARAIKDASGRESLTLEVSELAEISDKIFHRLDRKLAELGEIEKRLDAQRDMLEKLLARAESIKLPSDFGVDPKYREVRNLAKKGLKVDEIAGILDIPRGEVELILTIDK